MAPSFTLSAVDTQHSTPPKYPTLWRGRWLSILPLPILIVWIFGSLRYSAHGGPHGSLVLILTAALAAAGGWQCLLRKGSLTPASVLWAALLAEFLPEHLLGNWHAAKPHLLPTLLATVWIGCCLLAAWPGDALRSRLAQLVASVERHAALWLTCFGVLYFSTGSVLAIWKLHSFGYVGQDVAYFMQCLYTGLHGHLFWSNQYHDLLYTRTVWSDFAGHNQPVLFLLLPFYKLYPHAETLFLTRNLVLALAAYPAYRLTRVALQPAPALLITLAYLLAPAVLFQNFYDYAPLVLVALPLLFALLFYAEDKFGLYLAALALCLVIREDLVLVLFGLAALALFQRRGARWSLVPFALATAWALLTWRWILPHFQHGAVSAVQTCFAYLGATPSAMLHTVVEQPRLLLTHNVFAYLKLIFTPFVLVLPFLHPASLISLPYLLINILGDRGCNSAIVFRHYALIPTMLMLPGVVLATTRISRSRRWPIAALPLAALIVLSSATTSVLAVGDAELAWWHSEPWHAAARQVAAALPPHAAVAVPRYMLPLVANRDGVYQTPRLLQYHHPDAEFVVIDRDERRGGVNDNNAEAYALLQLELRRQDRFVQIHADQNYLIYRRIASPPLHPWPEREGQP